MELEKRYKFKFNEEMYELLFTSNWEEKPRAEIVRKALSQRDNDYSISLPPEVAISFAKKIIEEFGEDDNNVGA